MIIQLSDSSTDCRVFRLNEETMLFEFYKVCRPREWIPSGIYFVDYFLKSNNAKPMSNIYYSESIDIDLIGKYAEEYFDNYKFRSLYSLAEFSLTGEDNFEDLYFAGGYSKRYFPTSEIDPWGNSIPSYDEIV